MILNFFGDFLFPKNRKISWIFNRDLLPPPKIENLVEFSIEILFHGFLFVCYLFIKWIKETREFFHGFFLGCFFYSLRYKNTETFKKNLNWKLDFSAFYSWRVGNVRDFLRKSFLCVISYFIKAKKKQEIFLDGFFFLVFVMFVNNEEEAQKKKRKRKKKELFLNYAFVLLFIKQEILIFLTLFVCYLPKHACMHSFIHSFIYSFIHY